MSVSEGIVLGCPPFSSTNGGSEQSEANKITLQYKERGVDGFMRGVECAMAKHKWKWKGRIR